MPHYRDPQLQVTENYLDLYIQIIQIILCHFHKFKAFFSSLDYTQCTTESERKIIPCFKCCYDLQWNNRLNFMASEFFGQQRGCRFYTAGCGNKMAVSVTGPKAKKMCIWHCFLVDKGSDRYAIARYRPSTDLSLYRPKSSAICILSYDHPHV